MVEPGEPLGDLSDNRAATGSDIASAAEWLVDSEAARRLGVNERTIRRAIARHELFATKTAGAIRFPQRLWLSFSASSSRRHNRARAHARSQISWCWNQPGRSNLAWHHRQSLSTH
jgi:excisionase family DNA binding protein